MKRKTWTHPWRYRESFLVVLELILLGLIFEVITGGKGAPQLQWPVNLIVGLGILLSLIVIQTKLKNRPFVKWMSSIPAAISAILFFAMVTLLLGFIRQDNPEAGRFVHLLGLSHMKNSWLMMVSGLYFLVTLGMVAIRKSWPLKRKNLGFLLNHAGLWIIIFAAYLGSGDLMRLHLTLTEGHEATDIAMNPVSRQLYELPFSVELRDFAIEEYNPKIGIVDGRTGKLVDNDGQVLLLIEEGMKARMLDWDLEILKFEPNSFRAESEYFASDSFGAAPAALVRAVNTASGEERSGWISCGSFLVEGQPLELNQHRFLVMTEPEPKKYSSDIVIHDRNGETVPLTLEVNKPHKYKGWKLYQISYDDRWGKWSTVSILEGVRDPWLPVVYTGIFLLMAGALYLFWIGREIKE